VKAGARGVDMGRNIFQSDAPVGMIRAVRAVVHLGASVEEGYALYEREKATAVGR
jgi:putative autoinducer-2 (AI-2) aldolase